MKRFVTILAFVIASSCATATAFHGPVSDRPQLSITQQRHFEMVDPRLPQQLVTITTANISNPSKHPMKVILDCTETLTPVTIAPRTTEHVLLDPKDASCSLTDVTP